MKIISTNKKVLFHYDVLETFVAGIKLEGREIKSLRNQTPHFGGAYVSIVNSKPYLADFSIAKYRYDGSESYEPKRKRLLLLKKSEIERLAGKLSTEGVTVVPLEIGFEREWAKIKIALVRGKKLHDKRRMMKDREEKRKIDRIVKRA